MAPDAPSRGDFAFAKLREVLIFEAALVGVTAVYCLGCAGARMMGMVNSVPAICSGLIIVSHLISMWLRCRSPRLFWPSVCTLVADSMWVALGTTSFQTLLWETIWGEALEGESAAVPAVDQAQWESLWATFLMYAILNYQSSFVLSFRQVMVACPLAAAIYSSSCFASRGAFAGYVSTFDYSHLAMELVMFWCCIGLTAYSKKRSERVERSLFELSVAQKVTIINEKVLRCQAEYMLEVAKGSGAPAARSAACSEKSWLTGSKASRAGETSENGSHAQHSILSAPANMTPGQLTSFLKEAVGSSATGQGGPGCFENKGMDCLPLDAKVWIEGNAAPSPLQELAQGQRVLCYDALGNDVRYVTVVDARADFEDVEWVTVSLEDGTELTMTADHPVQPKRSAGAKGRGSNAAPVVNAADLSPGTDGVVVHRVVTRPVAVKEVSQPEICQGRGRMYVTMQHPDRHSLLVAGPNAQKDIRAMAVGSSDSGAVEQPTFEVRNTFLNLASSSGDLEHGGKRARRPQSEPPLFKAGRFSLEERPDGVEYETVDVPSQDNPSTISPESTEGECTVKVLDTTMAEMIGDRTSSAVARVSDLLRVNQMAWPSWGSRHHGSGDCRACDFQLKHGLCRQNKFCDHCHVAEDHRPRKPRGGAKHKKKAAGSGGGGDEDL